MQAKKKRVVFSWITRKDGRLCKALIAACADYSPKEMLLKDSKKRKTFFRKFIAPEILQIMPYMYDRVKQFYMSKGRDLPYSEYEELLYARFMNMYAISKGQLIRTREHPLKANNPKLLGAYRKAKGLLDARKAT